MAGHGDWFEIRSPSPRAWPSDIVVIDNRPRHKSVARPEPIERHLSPCKPEINPIEKPFGRLTTML
ncbi:MAG: hypothetical protein KF810_13555 [Rhizobiaceae bacterium]|nr:hypothetical protein [Rhizobiaceae bacterium]